MPGAELRVRQREAPRVLGEPHRVGVRARRPSRGTVRIPAATNDPDSTLVARALANGIGLARQQRLVDLEPVGRRRPRRRPRSARRPARRSRRRGRPLRRATSRDLAVADDARLRRASGASSRSRVRLARSSCTMPIAAFADQHERRTARPGTGRPTRTITRASRRAAR